jgi:glutamine synthetase
MLSAGLDGIRRELAAPDVTDENIYLLDNQNKSALSILPGSLNQALNALEQDDVIQAALGTHTFERFLSAKRLEWEDYRLDVTPWELKEYLANY